MADISILDITQAAEWRSYLDRMPPHLRGVYYSPEYYSIFETPEQQLTKCFVFRDGERIAIYPFFLNPVSYPSPVQYFDIQGAYGYNGVLSDCNEPGFIRDFFLNFDTFCQDQHVVSEFIRYNPVVNNHTFARQNQQIHYHGKNVLVKLQVPDFWNSSYDYSTRKNVNKAIRSGLKVSKYWAEEMTPELIEIFKVIYFDTLKRNNATDYYYFTPDFYQNIVKKLKRAARFYFVQMGDQYISCELVIISQQNAYSFLGGTLQDYFPYRPNDLLKHGIILDLKVLSFNIFCLGGGAEGILRYKKSFAVNGEVDFYIGKVVHNQEIYDQLIKTWEKENPQKLEEYGSYFQRYRY
jgi:hypothetical protein